MEEEYFLLGLDVSTKTIGVSLFNNKGQLLQLTHISPKAKPAPESKTEELIMKADMFAKFIEKYGKMNIKHVLIEEPLLRSNNVNTVGTLLRFNGMVTKICYDTLGVVNNSLAVSLVDLKNSSDDAKHTIFNDFSVL